VHLFEAQADGTWLQRLPPPPIVTVRAPPPGLDPEGRVELRKVERRQLFVDGRPIGQAFE
jgi:hypothetical protein